MTLKIDWIDRQQVAQALPSPDHPDGMDLDISKGASATCSTTLPYPAKRIGWFSVECQTCGIKALISTAGRADDPRSLKLACKL